jgi:hypothetical protein
MRLNLNSEIADFKKMIFEDDFMLSVQSTSEFWSNNKEKFPLLASLASVMLNINSSSAAIERKVQITAAKKTWNSVSNRRLLKLE